MTTENEKAEALERLKSSSNEAYHLCGQFGEDIETIRAQLTQNADVVSNQGVSNIGAFKYFKPPFRYEKLGQTIYCQDDQMCLQVRGWGNLIGGGANNLRKGDAERIQDEFAQWVTDCMNSALTPDPDIDSLKNHIENLCTDRDNMEQGRSDVESHLDLMVDEFKRIKSCPNVSDEIKHLCGRAVEITHQRVPLISQRDGLVLERDDLEAQIAELTKPEQAVDVEELKKKGTIEGNILLSSTYVNAWNECIDYLSEQGHLKAKGGA